MLDILSIWKRNAPATTTRQGFEVQHCDVKLPPHSRARGKKAGKL